MTEEDERASQSTVLRRHGNWPMVTVLPVKAGALRVSCLGLCGPEAEKVLGAGPGFNFRPSLTAPPHDKPYPALPPAPKEASEAGDAVCKDMSESAGHSSHSNQDSS